ncbi:hypothetical protein HPB47_018869, partial [Ixodes persulcatus]
DCIRRAQNQLQEPHRTVRQPKSAGASGVPDPPAVQRALPLLGRVLHPADKPAPHCLPHQQVQDATRDERPRPVRPDKHHECGPAEPGHEGGLGQAGLLPPFLLLLPLRDDPLSDFGRVKPPGKRCKVVCTLRTLRSNGTQTNGSAERAAVCTEIQRWLRPAELLPPFCFPRTYLRCACVRAVSCPVVAQ